MKRLLTTTTALSLAFAPMSPLPLAAQVAVDTPEGTAFCRVSEAEPCPEGEVCFLAQGGDCAAPEIAAEAAAALIADGVDTASQAEATEQPADPPDAPAAEQPPEPEAAPAAPAPEQPDGEVGSEALADETQAEDTAAGEAPAEEAPPAETPAGETSADVPPEGDAAQADVIPAPAPETGEASAPPLPPEDPAEPAAPPAGDVALPEAAPTPADTAGGEAAAPATPEGAAESAPVTDSTPETAAVPNDAAPTEAPAEIIGEAASVLQDILGAGSSEAEDIPPAAAAPETAADGDAPASTEAATVTETEITEENTRASSEDFAASPAPATSSSAAPEPRRGLSDLERFGLVALGALAVGAILKNGDQVVSNTGDRVVVEDDEGEFRVLKDDDRLLRQPGARLRTETFNDGSTRSTLARDDGSSIVTIRDASGRVLRRARYAPDGSELVLIDDLQQFERIDVSALPPPPAPRDQTVISAAQSFGDLTRALADIEARDNPRAFSLRQIRDYREVRALAPMIDVDSITFRTGSAAIDVSEAERLSALGRLIADLLEDRPYEIFLVEGHTDAVGSAASNLALSDRRAESVALALTEYFGIPPENLVVQGYGEAELRVPTQTAEERNRRVAVRLISPLLRTAANR